VSKPTAENIPNLPQKKTKSFHFLNQNFQSSRNSSSRNSNSISINTTTTITITHQLQSTVPKGNST
jgi:hypothetical protein